MLSVSILFVGYISWDSDWSCSVKLFRVEAEETLLPTWVSVLLTVK